MEPILLTFLILYGSTYSLGSFLLRKDDEVHKVYAKRRILG